VAQRGGCASSNTSRDAERGLIFDRRCRVSPLHGAAGRGADSCKHPPMSGLTRGGSGRRG
jgi:hypothetical protein